MKHWWKILTLCLVGTVSATVFTGCFWSPNLSASNHANEEQATNETTDNTATDDTNQQSDDIHDNTKQAQQANPNDENLQDTTSDNQNSHDTTTVDDNNQVTDPDENSTTNQNNDNTTPNQNESTNPEATETHADPAPHQHTSHDTWQITKAPTCTEAGQEVLYCTECNEIIDTRTISATGHNYNHYVTEPTCTTGGYTTHRCLRCGNTYEDTYTNALGHNYTITEVVAPTCTAQGYTEHKCSRCSASYKDTYTDINPQNHHYNEETHTCACGATDPDYQTTPTQDLGPIQNLEHTYWFFAEKNFAFLLKDFNAQANSGTYCSYKGNYANGIFTKDKTKSSPYNGKFTIVTDDKVDSGYTIKFEDTYCTNYNKTNSDADTNLIAKFTLTYVIKNTTPTTYTLEGKFISNNYTNYILTFIGDKAADEL